MELKGDLRSLFGEGGTEGAEEGNSLLHSMGFRL